MAVIWKRERDANGTAHATVNTRARCCAVIVPKGPKCSPPTTGYEESYCHKCHFAIVTDSMSKVQRNTLVGLMQREIRTKVSEETTVFKKDFEQREKEVTARLEAARKSETEIDKLRHNADKDKEAVEVGNAVLVLAKHFTLPVLDGPFGPYAHPFFRRR